MIIDFSSVRIPQIAIHKVGNKVNNEPSLISESLTKLSDELDELLGNYFLRSFQKVTETFCFVHEMDISANTLYNICKNTFENHDSFYDSSVQILTHLFEQSEHPHIKRGDVFIVLFDEILLKDDFVSAIGIFKAENVEDFIKTSEVGNQVAIRKEFGINARKLDKGCIILNTNSEHGFQILNIDNNKYDTEYWRDKFLQIDIRKDNNYETKAYIDLCKSFAKDVIAPAEGKKEQIEFLNQSVKYFDEQPKIETKDFEETIFQNDDLKDEFQSYQKEYEQKKNLTFSDAFEVAEEVLKKQKRSIKNSIKLDTNIIIKMDLKNPESSQKFIEQGYDEQKDMNFYKVYFNKEV